HGLVRAAALEPALGRLASGGHLRDQNTLLHREAGVTHQLREQLHGSDVHPAAGDTAVRDQLGHDAARRVDGNGEPYAHRAARGAVDHGVDADDLAAAVDERPPRVAGVDGRVGLDELVKHDAVVVL